MAFGSSLQPLGGDMLTTRWNIAPGWFAVGLATYDSNAFQGRHAAGGYILVIADEASGIEPEIWVGIDGLLSSHNSRLLAIGNPTDPSGEFAKMFKNKNVKRIYISAFETPNFTAFGITLDDIRSGEWEAKITGELPVPGLVDPEWVRLRWEKWGEESPLWTSRVMGRFPESSDDTLIRLSWVENSMRLWEKTAEGTPAVAGIDIARFGSDRSCIAIRRGQKIMKLKVYSKLDLMALTGQIVNCIKEEGLTKVLVDVIGMGGGVVDRLKELRMPVKGINVGDNATDTERFLNLRAEMWWTIREALDPDPKANPVLLILPPDEELENDLTGPRYKYTSRGQIQVESKEDMKKRGLRSTDLADAVGLAILGAFRRKKKQSFKIPDVAAFEVRD
jgi:hypothetical protein